jgi:hypothetical protein
MKRMSRDWELALELSCHAGIPTVWISNLDRIYVASGSGINFKTNVEVVLFKRENLIKTMWWLSV